MFIKNDHLLFISAMIMGGSAILFGLGVFGYIVWQLTLYRKYSKQMDVQGWNEQRSTFGTKAASFLGVLTLMFAEAAVFSLYYVVPSIPLIFVLIGSVVSVIFAVYTFLFFFFHSRGLTIWEGLSKMRRKK